MNCKDCLHYGVCMNPNDTINICGLYQDKAEWVHQPHKHRGTTSERRKMSNRKHKNSVKNANGAKAAQISCQFSLCDNFCQVEDYAAMETKYYCVVNHYGVKCNCHGIERLCCYPKRLLGEVGFDDDDEEEDDE